MPLKGLLKLIKDLLIRLAVIIGIITLGLYWGRLFEAILTLVAILQFELACRQHWLNKLRDEPSFAIYASKQDNNSIYLEITNVSTAPAYLVRVSRVLHNGVPLPPEEWTQHIKTPWIACLAPSRGGTLAIISKDFYDKYFRERGGVLEVSYVNKYSEWKSLLVSLHELTPIIHMPVGKQPGFLLSLADYIMMLKALTFLYKLKQK